MTYLRMTYLWMTYLCMSYLCISSRSYIRLYVTNPAQEAAGLDSELAEQLNRLNWLNCRVTTPAAWAGSQDLPNPQDIRRETSYPAMFFRSMKAKRMWVNHNVTHTIIDYVTVILFLLRHN